jgi:putative ABC transport system ATP-binding protein
MNRPPTPAAPPDRPAAVPVVELSDVTKTYTSALPVTALREVNLTVQRGDYVAIMGPSGSGKSTLLNILGLLDEPTSGEYRLNGQPTSTLNERDRCAIRAHDLGFVFQSFHLVNYRTAAENVETGLLYQHVPARQRRQRAHEVLTQVGLEPRMHATPNEMSGGERQRVAIARALIRRPALVLCDEPTGNLDTTSGNQILDLLDRLVDDGLTVIIITHDPTVAARTHHQATITDGRLQLAAAGGTTIRSST